MKIALKVEGGSEMARKLHNLPSSVSLRVQVAALKKGAEPIRAKAAALAPRDDSAPHMADNILIGVPTQKERDEIGAFDQAVVEVGPSRRHFYGFFQEFGTAFHPAQPFMRPAFDSEHKKSLAIIAAELWQSIKRIEKRLFNEAGARAGSSRARSSGMGV